MRVSRSRKPLQHKNFYSLGNEILQEVSDAKYLGIQIDNKLDWNKHISTVAARGQSKLAFLNRNLIKNGSKEESLLVVDPFGRKSNKYSSTHPQQPMF